MKRLKSFIWLFAMTFAASVAFTSCGDDDSSDAANDPDTPITPVTPDAGSAMSPDDQKEYLETVALEFMDNMPSSDFSDIISLVKYISDTYTDNYDWDNVGDWAADIFDASREALGTTTTETETYTWGEYTDTYNYIYTNYKALIMASNFTGHFKASNGSWTLTKASDLQFIFKDQNGKECVLKVETGGSVKKVYMFNDDEWVDYEWKESGKNYTVNEYYDRTQCTIGLPETIVATLTQGGSQVVKTTVKTDLSSLSGEEFDISRSNFTVSVVTELNNGYTLNLSQVAYTANSKASLSFVMSKNGKNLLAIGASANVSGLPSCNVSDLVSENADEDDFDKASVKNAYVKLDILGKAQIQGEISDVLKFADYLDLADENDESEATYKSYINQANGLADINLFYDGKAVKQATVKFEPFAETGWGGHTYWTAEPVLNFYDGSSYSTFEAFFNDTDFKESVNAFKTLANKYAELVGERIDW